MALAILLPLSLAACSSGAAAAGDDRPCLEVSPELLTRIAEGASGVAITPVRAMAVESQGVSGFYVVAMEFSGDDGLSETGAWAASAIDGGATTLLAVDGYAQSFTRWPRQVGEVKLSVTTDGVTEATACLNP
jgi:hypothetical protein